MGFELRSIGLLEAVTVTRCGWGALCQGSCIDPAEGTESDGGPTDAPAWRCGVVVLSSARPAPCRPPHEGYADDDDGNGGAAHGNSGSSSTGTPVTSMRRVTVSKMPAAPSMAWIWIPPVVGGGLVQVHTAGDGCHQL